MSSRLALVTGSTGFLGRHVVREMTRRGFSVRALARSSCDWQDPAVRAIEADLCTSELSPYLAGVDVVVHLAARLSGSDEEMHRANVTGTRRLMEAMTKSTCRRLVHASSFSVYRWDVDGGSLDECSALVDDDVLGTVDSYSSTKVQQERLIREFSLREGWIVTVIRPAAIWDSGHFPEYVVGPRLGPIQLVIGPRGYPRISSIQDAATCFATAAAREEGPREMLLNVLDESPPRRAQFARVGDKPDWRVKVPVPYALAKSAVRLLRLVRGQRRLPFFLQHHSFACLYSPTSVRTAGASHRSVPPSKHVDDAGMHRGVS